MEVQPNLIGILILHGNIVTVYVPWRDLRQDIYGGVTSRKKCPKKSLENEFFTISIKKALKNDGPKSCPKSVPKKGRKMWFVYMYISQKLY